MFYITFCNKMNQFLLEIHEWITWNILEIHSKHAWSFLGIVRYQITSSFGLELQQNHNENLNANSPILIMQNKMQLFILINKYLLEEMYVCSWSREGFFTTRNVFFGNKKGFLAMCFFPFSQMECFKNSSIEHVRRGMRNASSCWV